MHKARLTSVSVLRSCVLKGFISEIGLAKICGHGPIRNVCVHNKKGDCKCSNNRMEFNLLEVG